MAGENQVEIQITLNDGQVLKGLGNIKRAAEEVGQSSGQGLSGMFKAPLKSLVGFKTALLGVAAAIGAGALFKEGIQAAIAQEDAVNRLNQALLRSGQATQIAGQNISDTIDALSQSSTFGGEAILEAAAKIQTIGQTSAQTLQPATQAALDLAAALRIDLNTAATMVGKAANGNVDSFKKFGIEVQKGKTDAETFSNALAALNKNFGGAAAAATNTFSGALNRASSSFSDILKVIGEMVIQSPVVISVIKTMASWFVRASESLKSFVGGRDLVGQFVLSLLDIGESLALYVIPPLELLYNIGKTIFLALAAGAGHVAAALLQPFKLIAQGAKVLGVGGPVADALIEFTNSVEDASWKASEATNKSFGQILDYKVSDTFLTGLKEMRANAEQAAMGFSSMAQAGSAAAEQPQKIAEAAQALHAIDQPFQFAHLTFANFELALNQMAQKTSVTMRSISQTMVQSLGNGVGQAFAAMGRAFARGENALEAMGKQMLAVFGQMAVQLGSMFILQGIAMSLGGFGSGIPLIAAGAALAAFGGLLSALGGGAEGARQGSVPGATGGAGPNFGGGVTMQPGEMSDLQSQDLDRRGQTQVAVNIQGDVFDSETTGLRIARILNDAFDTSGLVVAGRA